VEDQSLCYVYAYSTLEGSYVCDQKWHTMSDIYITATVTPLLWFCGTAVESKLVTDMIDFPELMHASIRYSP